MEAGGFLSTATLKIMGLGLIAFMLDTVAGLLFGKLMAVMSGYKINPLIGASGISAFPMAGRIAAKMASEEDPDNYILMHAMGANTAGQLGSVIAGGILLAIVLNLFNLKLQRLLYSRLNGPEYNLFMNIRPFQLPQDIDLMNSLVVEGFQYPENPAWSVQEDEIQGMVDQLKGAKRLWPVLRILRIFVPLFRDILCGFIDEEEGKPAGLINYMRQRNAPEWYIANVTVLPAYRRRGIARRLVEETLDELRHRKAEVAFLDVVVGNDPAFNLYKEMGFEEFTQSSEYQLHKESIILPKGFPQDIRSNL